MIEMDETEYSLSTVEDSELIAVLSFYDHLPAQEAIALKDMLLYDRLSRTTPSDARERFVMGVSYRNYTSVHQDKGRPAQKKAK